MGRLKNQAAVITGGGSGMGAAVVARFVEEGARVVVLDRSRDKLDDIQAVHGDAVRTVLGSVTEYHDNAHACSVAEQEFGSLDVFVGNAGLWDFSRSLLGATPEQLSAGFDELFAVNVKGYVLGAKAAAAPLRASRGSMVFTHRHRVGHRPVRLRHATPSALSRVPAHPPLGAHGLGAARTSPARGAAASAMDSRIR
jgi:NAD(P)-dependent dehydrogenase (short-subunit alcohol dehydrogenase family)